VRKPFKSNAHNIFFARNGYVLLPQAVRAEDLQAIFPANYLAFKHYRDHHFTSHDSPDPAMKLQVTRDIERVLAPVVSQVLESYRPVVSSFHVKLPDDRSKLKIHQNPTFVDEAFYSSLVCWAPLQPVNRRNGTLFIIPGTHRMFPTYRVANFVEEKWLDKIEQKLIRRHAVDFDLSPGDLLFFDDAVFHGSFPNRSDEVRISIAQVNVPAESELLYCRKNGGDIELLQVADEFYVRMSEPGYMEDRPDIRPFRTIPRNKTQNQLKYSEFKSLYDYYQ
jgi:hypothetical protein